MDEQKRNGLRQRWKRNGREIRGTVAVIAVLVVATGTAISLFLSAFTQTRPTYCGQKHEHTIACYSNPQADVETAKKWEKTLPAADDETPRVSKLVNVVRSQVGYHESKDNYAVEGDILHGYTRYGAWDGDPYEPWNATFVEFCLHYAGIDMDALVPQSADADQAPEQDDVPVEGDPLPSDEANNADESQAANDSPDNDAILVDGSDQDPALANELQDAQSQDASSGNADDSAQTDSASDSQAVPQNILEAPRGAEEWQQRFVAAGLYVPLADANPRKGDVVFLREPDAASDLEAQITAEDVAGVDTSAQTNDKPLRMAIVTAVNNKDGHVRIVEGDAHDAVEETWYPANDAEIVGYGTMPAELRDELTAYKKLVAERKKAEKEAAKKAAEEEAARKAEEEAAKKAAEEEAAKKAAEEAAREAEQQPVSQVLTAEVDGYRIQVNLGSQAQEGYALQAKPLKATKKRLAAVEDGLSQELPDGATKQAHVDASDVVLFDISVRDKDGNEVELSKKVRITVTQLEDETNKDGEQSGDEARASEAPASQAPEVVHFADEGTEVLNAKPKDEGFTFTTKSLSPFAFVFTVDFEYQGYEWSMPGEGSALLSQVLNELHVADFAIVDVVDAAFSNPELVEVAPQDSDGKHDWLLTSKKPFTSNETLTLALASGDTVSITVTDGGSDGSDINPDDTTSFYNIRRLLTRVQFYDGDTLVGDSSAPESMVVRPGHEYTMHLHFAEDEDEDPAEGQLPDDGVMYYRIPDGVFLAKKAFDENSQVTFDIVLDRKRTLTGNTVTYIPAANGTPAYLKITWNSNDAANYKLLKASPRTVFMLSFPYTTAEVDERSEIEFSDSAILNVENDPTYGVALEKIATPNQNNKEIIDYVVMAVADGSVTDVLFTDVMGAALTYRYSADNPSAGVRVTYRHQTGEDADGNPIYEDYTDQNLPPEYGDTNKKDFHIAVGDHGFDFKLATLHNSDMAVIEYSANVDYIKIGGKNNIGTTSRNTVTAKDNNDNLLATATQALDTSIDYLQIGKRLLTTEYVYVEQGEGGETQEVTTTDPNNAEHGWDYMYAKWQVIYNPDHQIHVEGATLKDTVWMGKKYSTTYATDRPFAVTAYESGDYEKDDGRKGDTFTPTSTGTPIITPTEANGNGWDALDRNDVAVTQANQAQQQLSSWEWTIPEGGVVEGLSNAPHTYIVEYWTKIAKAGPDDGGYVGNQVSESIADITRDKSVELPGVGPGYDIEVDKEHVIDVYEDNGKVYTNWKISFKRRESSMERALVEDTLPHILLKDDKGERVCTDRFVSDIDKYKMTVTGLYGDKEGDPGQEQCVPSLSLDGYDVVFWFFKNRNNITDPDITTPGQGLYGAKGGSTDEENTITISFWTENDQEWIEATADGKAINEHWNHVHLILNGKEAVDRCYAVPKPEPSIKKSVETVGSWTDGNTTLPVYRYTLTLNGLNDDLFGELDEAGNYKLVVNDNFSSFLEYLPVSLLPEATNDGNRTTTITSENPETNGKVLTLNNRLVSDETLARPQPKRDSIPTWPATFSDPQPVEGNGERKQLGITVTITPEQRAAMKYQVMAEDGVTPLINEGGTEVWVYGRSYEVSYYLAPNFSAVKAKAQQIVDEKDYAHTKLVFENEAEWKNIAGEAGTSKFSATTDYNLNPVQKNLVSYDPNSELATYSIDVNPLMLRMNNGERYSVQDAYSNLAVDFQTVHIETFPAGREGQVEWVYHDNKGTFWVPDETRVRISYEGWPVGRRSNADLQFKNTASIGGFNDPVVKTAKLSVDHEGHASTYHVRIFKFEDDNMNTPLAGAVFQLFERDASGNIVPMEYKADCSVPIEDDAMWQVVNTDRVTAGKPTYPTPENHVAGDHIYFITGNGSEHSAQAGFADVMLSQSRDGVALKKGKQYYLLEVEEPDGHTKEDIYWRFIIGDNDDWENYVYSDDSILQVSNASLSRVLTVRKTFIDRTAAQRITYDQVQKGVQFKIEGKSLEEPHNVIYNKTVDYSDFKTVDTPLEGGGTKREYLLIIRSLPPGNYKVSEVRSSVFTGQYTGAASDDDTDVFTTVDGSATVRHVDSQGESIRPDTTAEANFVTGTDAQTSDTFFTFTVPNTDVIVEGVEEHTETSAEGEFTNIYTDPNPVSITVSKTWDANNKSDFKPIKAEFALYADGVKYNLTKADGANERGNIEVVANSEDAAHGWVAQKTIVGLPRIKLVGDTTQDIVWAVEEVSATYHTGTLTNPDSTVTGIYLGEHFSTTQTTTAPASQGEPTTVAFTNTFNNLTTVTVHKAWADDELQGHHTDDVVYFDLYRTTTDITGYTEAQLRDLVAGTGQSAGLEPLIQNIELSYNTDPSKSFTYQNDLLEKAGHDGARFYYFALERSVAGYEDSYERSATTEGQTITITNTPHNATDPKGTLTIQKNIGGNDIPNDLNKTYKFTLWNSGKYLQDDQGALGPEPHEFQIQPGESNKITIENVKLGTYILKEVKSAAQVGGYTLTSATVKVNDGAAVEIVNKDYATEVTVEANTTTVTVSDPENPEITHEETQVIPTDAVVTNTYAPDTSDAAKTEYTFGKLWVMPNTEDTTTLPWPNNVSITMQLGRRIKGQANSEDANFSPTYTFAKTTGYAITETHSTGDPANVEVNNPDEPESSDTDAEDVFSYHHYTFTVKDLPKYDAYGNEWEYFAKETAVKDTAAEAAAAGSGNLQDSDNTTGRYFTEHYGVVDGIVARILADEKTENADNDTSVGVNGNVGYAINRLVITDKANVPVKKFINGWPNWGERDENDPFVFSDADYEYPEFTFKLYDAEGNPVRVGNEPQVDGEGKPLLDKDGHQIVGTHVSVKTNSRGEAEFQIPDDAIDPTKMMWWADEQVLYGTQSFWIKEDANDPAPSTVLDNTNDYEYYGVSNYTGSARVTLSVKYNWLTGALVSTAKVTNTSYEYEDQNGVERGVINNSYDPGETSLTVTKTWDDANNQDGYRRPVQFKVHAKYYVGTSTSGEGADPQPVYEDLDKVWFVQSVKRVNSSGKKVTSIEHDEIVLNDAADPTNEYRITLEPGSGNTSTKTVKLPKYYEGHLIIYSVEEMLDESIIKQGATPQDNVTLANKYTKSSEAQDNDQNVTNTHEPDKLNLHFQKVWEGNDPNVASRTITVQLKAKYGNTTITSDNVASNTNWSSYASEFEQKTLSMGTIEDAADHQKWLYDWKDLPRFAPGSKGSQVVYTVEEVETSIPVGYYQSGSAVGTQVEDTDHPGTYDQNASITNTYEPIDIPIQKIWEDDNNRDALRPTSVTYKLKAEVDGVVIAGDNNGTVVTGNLVYQNGDPVTEAELSKTLSTADVVQGDANTWLGDGWVGLPKYWHGKEITYTVTEDLPADLQEEGKYTISDTTSSVTTVDEGEDSEHTQDLRSITNTHEIYTTQLELTKTWVDQNNQDGKRPTPLVFEAEDVYLTAKIAASGDSVQLKVGNQTGEDNTYYVVYDSDGDSTTAPVQFMDAEVVIEGSNGAYDLDSVAPEEQAAYLAAYNTYTITYKNLPRYRDQGTEIEYALTEGQVEYYYRVAHPNDTNASAISVFEDIDMSPSSTEIGDDTRAASVINKYDPEHIDLTVTKRWDHGQNPQNPLPNQAAIKLVATSATSRIDSKTAWHNRGYEFEPVETLTGSYVDDQTTPNAKGFWGGLPKNMPGRVGEEVTYSVEEVNVPDGYRVVYEELPTGGLVDKTHHFINVTNTYEETEVTATKVWDDANNQDGLRKTLQFKLQRKLPGETSFSDVLKPDTQTREIKEISALSPAAATWSHLLAWKNNQRVEYRVVEIPNSDDTSATLENYLTGYTTTYGNFAYPSAITPAQTTGGTPTYKIEGTNATITNTHTPQTYTQSNPLTFTKTWDHKGVVYEYPSDLTTSQYINKLHLWARVEGTNATPVEVTGTNWSPELVENNDWKSHATVGEGYVVTITDLPLYKPQSAETDNAQALEYFISEDEGGITHYTMTTTADATVGNNKLVKLCSNVTPLSNVQVKNERDTGGLKIAKSVVSDLAADHAKPFSFTITTNPTVTGLGASYTYTVANDVGITVSSGTVTFQNGESSVITLQSGQTATIEGLPVGVVYTVMETQETDFEVPQYKIDNTGEFVDVTSSACVCDLSTKDQTVKAEFNNIRKKNDLVVSKTVHSMVRVDKTRDYVFQVTLSDTSINKTYNTVKTTANNTTTGGTITFTNGVSEEVQLKHGETLRIVDLPVTVGYTVHEVFQTDDSTKLVSVDDRSGSISSSEASTASFTNQRQTGSLKLAKKLLNHIPTDDGDTFYFDVELVGDDGQALDLTDTVAQISVKVNGTVKSFDAQPAEGDTVSGYPMYYDASTKTLKNVPVVWRTSLLNNVIGGTTEILGLPVGTTYSATEKDLTTITTKGNLVMHSGAVPTSPAQIATGEQTADFVNTRKTGSLSVTKHVVSPIPAERDSNATYNLTVTLNTAHGSKGNAGSVSATLKRSTDAVGSAGTPITFTDGAYTITGIHHDETVTIEGIPTDLTYLVAETGLNGTKFNNTIEVKTDTGQGQDVYQDITDPNVSRNILADQTPAEVRVTNTRKTGSLKVHKTVHSSVSTDSSRKFDYTVVVTDPDNSSAVLDTTVGSDYYGAGLSIANGNTFTFTLTSGQTQTITNLPDGWVYKVTESSNTGTDGISLDKFDTTYTKSGTVSATGTGTEFDDTSNAANKIDSTTSTVDFTNTRKTGNLTITKALSNAIPTDDGDTFYFDVEVKGDDGQALTLDSTHAPIMVGNTKLTQTSGTDRALYYDASTCKIKNVPVQFSKNGTNAITITGLPQGATYRVSETGLSMAINGMDSGHITQQSETVPATSADAGTIDADGESAGFSNARQTGDLSITKTVHSPVQAEEAASRTYEVTINLQTKHTVDGEKKPVDVTATLSSNDSQTPSNAENTVTFTNGVATIYVHNGETVTLTGIPVDVEYTISEENESLFSKAYTAGGQTGQTAEIPVGTTSAATITNTRKTDGLAVDKTVHSTVPSDKSKKFTFTVHVEDPNNPDFKIKATNGYGTRIDGGGDITFDENNNTTFTLANNDEAQIIANLPTDWTYTVTEMAVENFTTTKSADRGTITATQSSAAFTNKRNTGTLTLTKTLTNAIPTDDGDTFYFDVALTHGTTSERLVLDTNAPIKVGSVTLTATPGSGREPYYDATNGIIRNVPVVWHKADGTTSAGGTTVISGLPIDTTCTATELTTAKEVGGQNVVIPVMTPEKFETSIDPPATGDNNIENKITANDSDKTADFTNARHVGSLQISKSVSSALAADYNENFAFAVQSDPVLTGDYNVTYSDNTTGTLTFDSTGKATGQLPLKSGQHVTIAGLPVDVDYTVTENLTQAQQADFDATSDPTNGKQQTHKDSTDTVSFTNTRKHGRLNVSKTMVSPDDADKTKVFDFTVTLSGLKEELNTVTYGDVTFTRDASTGKYVGTFSQHDGQTKTFSGLPTDATYTVTEASVTNYTTAKTGDTGTIGDTASTAAFTNTREVGNLKIQKSLTKAIPDDTGDVFYFDVALTDGQDSAHPLHLDLSNDAPAVKVGNTRLTSTTAPTQTDDKSLWYEYDSTKAIIHNVPLTWNSGTGATNEVLITGLPQAATCTVKETGFTVPADMDEANITKDGTASAQKTIDATVAQEVAFTNVRKTGNLQIKKAVESPVDTELTDTYTLTVTLATKKNHTAVPLAGLVMRRQQENESETTGTIDFNSSGVATINGVHRNETITIEGIPTEVNYTISESGADDFAKKFEVKGTNNTYSAIPEGGVEIIADQTSEALVTNTRNTGELKVSKTVKSTVQGDKTHRYEFVVRVAPPSGQSSSKLVNGSYSDVQFTNNVSETITLAHRGEKVIAGLPTGWTYTVTETDVTNITTTKSADTGTITATQSNAAFTNTRDTGTLTINKKLEHYIPTDSGDTFYFDVTVVGDDGKSLQLDNDNAPITVGGVNLTATSGSEHQLYYDAEAGVIHNVPVTWNTPLAADGTGGATVITGLPVGTTCTSAELATNYVTTASTDTAAAAANIDRHDGNIVATMDADGESATFTNSRKLGSLTINKQVVSPIADEEGQEYEVVVSLKPRYGATTGQGVNLTADLTWAPAELTGKPTTLEFEDGVAKAVLKLSHNESVTLSNIPTDLTYTITENDAANFNKTFSITGQTGNLPTTGSLPASGHITTTASTTVVTNTRKTGQFSVKKTVQSSVKDDKTHDFHYKVVIDGATIKDGTYGTGSDALELANNSATFTLHDGQTKTITGIPTGLTYTVTETAEGTGDATEQAAEQTYLNKFNIGWEKTVTGQTGDKPSGTTAEFPGEQTGLNTINTDEPLIDYTNERKVGQLTLSKTLNNAIPIDEGDTFYYDVTLRGDDGKALDLVSGNPPITVTVDGTEASLADPPASGTQSHDMYYDADNGILRNVPVVWHAADGSTVISGLPNGTTCTATELVQADTEHTVQYMTPPGFANNIKLTSSNNVENTIGLGDDAAQTAAFINERKASKLAVKKVVESPVTQEKDSSRKYTIKVQLKTKKLSEQDTQQNVNITANVTRDPAPQSSGSGQATPEQVTFTNGVAQIEVAHNETVTLEGIPTDVEYTVTEEGEDLFTKAFTNQTGNIVAGSIAQAQVTNTRKLGNLSIKKTVESTVASDKMTHKFTFEIEVTPPSNQSGFKLADGTYSGLAFTNNKSEQFSLAHNGTKTIEGLPTDWTYRVTEISDTNFNTTATADTGTISATQSNAAFTNTRKTGSLKLLKLVKSPFKNEQDAYYPLTVNLHMPADGGAGPENISAGFAATGLQSGSEVVFHNGVATVNVKDGSPVTISGLPMGAEYVVTETSNNSTLTPEATAYKVVNADGTMGDDSRASHTIAKEDATYGAQITNVRNSMLISIGKISALDYSKTLTGARFTLTPVNVTDSDALGWTSKELVSDTDGYLYEVVQESGVDTKVKQFNVKPGQYQLVENKAPLGYHKLAQPATFTVTSEYSVMYTDSIIGDNPRAVDSTAGADNADPTKRYVMINVANSTGAELPSTGGSDTAATYIAGCASLAFVGIVALLRRKINC